MLKRARGVTLIELMIGLAIFAMLLGVGLPSLGAWLANSRVRATAESLQSGLAMARSEAMRRNQNVEFLVTNDTIDLGTVPTVTPEANGMHWLVRFMDPAVATYSMVDSRVGLRRKRPRGGAGPGGAGRGERTAHRVPRHGRHQPRRHGELRRLESDRGRLPYHRDAEPDPLPAGAGFGERAHSPLRSVGD